MLISSTESQILFHAARSPMHITSNYGDPTAWGGGLHITSNMYICLIWCLILLK